MHLLTSTTTIGLRVAASFWIFGLINNVLYVIIISAAVDLVPSNIPKGTVLLADVFPSFMAKLLAPYVVHLIPYGARMFLCAGLSTAGMLLIAYTPNVPVKMLGIGLASLSSGLGELTFLGLTHFFGRISLAGWSSGTGAAGLVGAGLYSLATITLGLSSQSTITSSATLPVIMVLCYFIALPNAQSLAGYTAVTQREASTDPYNEPESRSMPDHIPASPSRDEPNASLYPTSSSVNNYSCDNLWTTLQSNLSRAKKLVYPYMLPLFLVYVAEYTAISGVAPTLLFPLHSTPFHTLRDFYPTYNALYQAGVFISRNSILFLRLHNIYFPSLLQLINLAILTAHALLYFLPNVWAVFAIFFWTGLLGGAVYVNAFAKVSDEVVESEREFSLSATTVADSSGILTASLLSMGLETVLCDFQVRHGREWCKLV